MIIDHRRLKDAIIHLANKLQQEYPNNRYWLNDAQLGGIGWTIDITEKRLARMDFQPLAPPFVNIDELADEYDTPLENIVIDTGNMMLCLEVADNFVRTLDNLADNIRLFKVFASDNWVIIYFAKNLDGANVVITLQINRNGVIISSEIRTMPLKKR